MSDRRISAAEVIAAYRETDNDPNITPVIQALYEAAPEPKTDLTYRWAYHTYGIEYTDGFCHGSDDNREYATQRYVEGYADGQAVWAAVEKELLGVR